jgi:hypothetical protein
MSRITRTAALLAVALITAAALAVPAGAASQRSEDRAGADAAKVLPKRWAKRHGVRRAKADPDRDGLTNWGELRSRTNPRRADLDRDGTKDGAEDRDRDRLANAAEERTGHDPRAADSDGDGTPDGEENAGVVTAFDGTTLTIALAAGGTLTGAVDADVTCDGAWPEDEDEDWEDDADSADDDEQLTAHIAEQGDEDDPDDEQWDDDCLAALAPGDVVHEAELEDGVLVALELLDE